MSKRPENLFPPARLPRRDVYGLLVHPDMRPYYREMDWWITLQEMGFEEQVEVFMDKACANRFRREALEDCSWWLPVSPDGGNWRLVSILFSEEDDLPVAFYVRHRKFSDRIARVPASEATA